MLKVEQADRVLASQIVISTENAKRILAGEYDDHPWVRKVAQYREDTALPLREVCQAVVDVSKSSADTVSFLVELNRIAIMAAKALSPDTTGGD